MERWLLIETVVGPTVGRFRAGRRVALSKGAVTDRSLPHRILHRFDQFANEDQIRFLVEMAAGGTELLPC